jgi:pyruvate/2-oxoglutarate dehydrogenase complex dihydrolipoamide acyltransferase (E2) component
MAAVVIPSVGIAMEEALIVKWLKEPGDTVAVDEPVAEIETDKATMDILSPEAGVLGPHLFEPGALVPVGATIVEVDVAGAAAAPEAEAPAVEAAPAAAAEPELDAPAVAPAAGERAPHAISPRARRLARERDGQAAGTPPPAGADEGRFRELIAAKVAESWREIPHFTVSREIDAEPMQALLVAVRAAGYDPKPTFTDLRLRALALALRETGATGAVDVGVAVATPRGVVIPVVRDVLALDAAGLARSRSAAVERARAGKLGSDDLTASPATTLSNLGSFGVDRFTGIVALGQTSLVTVGRSLPRVVADESGAIRVRTMFDATVNADHRTVDGAEAARLLVAFATAAEESTSAF